MRQQYLLVILGILLIVASHTLTLGLLGAIISFLGGALLGWNGANIVFTYLEKL